MGRTSSGSINANPIQPSFRYFCLADFPCSGIFRCTAVQTHKPSVTRHDERMPNVPRVVGSGSHVVACE